MIRVALPAPLRALAGLTGETAVAVAAPVTLEAVLEAVEAAHPMLRGTIRDPATGARRALVRFFAAGADFSHASPRALMPASVAAGREPLLIVGAIAGG